MSKIRGEKIVYEREEEVGDICIGCPFRPFGGSCLAWRYVSPEICAEIKKEIRDEPLKTAYISSPKEYIGYQKVLSQWDYKTREKRYAYYRVKSRLDYDGITIVSVRRSTRERYEKWMREEKRKKKKKKQRKLELPPVNPWA